MRDKVVVASFSAGLILPFIVLTLELHALSGEVLSMKAQLEKLNRRSRC